MKKQADRYLTPFFSELLRYLEQGKTGFHTPGHRGGISWGDRWQPTDLPKIDLTEISGLDWERAKNDAEGLAAEFYHADRSFFLVQGATQGLHAAMLGCFNPGDQVLIARNCHSSVYHGLILADLFPVYIDVDYVPGWGLPEGVNLIALQQAVKDHPDAKGIILTNPTYQGIATPVVDIREIIGERILIIDEAHGGHFDWWGKPDYSAYKAADLWIHGTHKFLGSLTQTGFLHLKGTRVDPEKIDRSLQWISTTSPSFILMASLDLNRAFLAEKGQALFNRSLTQVMELKWACASLPGVRVLLDKDIVSQARTIDPWRLCCTWLDSGLTGYEVDRVLREQWDIQVEYADYNQVTMLLPPWQPETDLQQLVEAFQKMAESNTGKHQRDPLEFRMPVGPVEVAPRKIAFAETRLVTFEAAVGQIAAEAIAPYPPGIPLVGPGERITGEMIEVLRNIQRAGGVIRGMNVWGEIKISCIEDNHD